VTLRNRLFTRVVTALLISVSPGYGLANFQADSLALFGKWRWVRSAGGLLAANATPPPSGWSRTLHVHPDGRYAFWERDSVRTYLLCTGKFIVHRFMGGRRDMGGASFWIELDGWWSQLDQKSLVTFMGRDTILTYPGGDGFGVSDALYHTFVRETSLPGPPAPDRGQDVPGSVPRPPRIGSGLPGSYYVQLSPPLSDLLQKLGPFHEWMDWQYPSPVRAAYEYTNSQVPSAIIGDFDGDSLADVAVHGSTGYAESKVVCILSNRRDPRAITLFSEPTLFDPPDNPDTTASRYREPRPTLYLKLQRAGQSFEKADASRGTLSTDAILVVRPNGAGTVYYYENGTLRTGRPTTPLPAWPPTPLPKRR